MSREIDRRLAASNKEGKVEPEALEEPEVVEERGEEEAERSVEKVYRAPEKEEREENFLEAWMRKKSALKTEVGGVIEARVESAKKVGAEPQEKARAGRKEDFWHSDDEISLRA